MLLTGNFYGPKVERVRIDELADDRLRDYRINGKRSLDDLEARSKLHRKPISPISRRLTFLATSSPHTWTSDRSKGRRTQPSIGN
jgi:hypothetical protein